MFQCQTLQRTLLAVLIATTLLAGTSQPAQAGSFDGPFAQLGIGMGSPGSTSTNYIGGNRNYLEQLKGNQSGILGNVAVGYSYELPHSFNIAANAFYNFGYSNAGFYQYIQSQSWQIQNKVTNIGGISIEPGYNITEKSLGFLKLGWARATTSSYVTTQMVPGKYSGTAHGFLYGLGLKQLITDHVYVGIEVYQVAFSATSDTIGTDTVTMKPSFTFAGVNVGYKF